MLHEIIMAGFGGQGIMSMGQLLTYAGMFEGKHVAWIPSYGPEMRGGTANCGVTVSDRPISSPVVFNPTAAIIMNIPSLDKFEPAVKPGGLILVNSSLVDRQVKRTDIKAFYIPANEIAEELGNPRVAGMVILGALVALTSMVSFKSLEEALKKVLPEYRHKLIPLNMQALERGATYVSQQLQTAVS
ncbi:MULTISPECIES: 2-oxoacid:acceptor oxidoreductase family protein [Carboxydocella]|uniref:2-oxoglutarate ferredoxin oxidoreductase subunit gamma n=2 Tax=Carboxydocella TaxID=178898 RepID=A0A1T4NJ98_9FIRM|nr:MULTISPECIES: 2-oxoacid:acceptor oxidoreductase family protein [Carboxydocella]AVX20069.1 2-oxoglutarate ferredoxin oxidoreductase subunit gamma [Carboxydocella thermautotrophica]AVX30486.1 2-oxoglutarate ferredoxin oxidoreductase subunit gamma [Carboxydocella thermautotrophica]SJZ79334.1 2-oxoglutarate ferredoxin oxidoreductase subunit gamma [Carboxydocella sporoproducens DSM 16521]GAW27855.1 2-oxoglutarate ferredoxin oxidoreductase subunit gamma [Carboxydocella sp. ULO1]GAW32676.1 2-oxogl